jgi:hypothetical protein
MLKQQKTANPTGAGKGGRTGKRTGKGLANLWSRQRITKKAHAGRGLETIWEMSNENISTFKHRLK